jgi:sulfur-carrier protein
MIRVQIPTHLQRLANTARQVEILVMGPVTQRTLLDALEAEYPMLKGTIRDQITKERRAFIRFFACGEDLSLELPDALLPEAVALGKERFMIVGAMAGG